MNHTTCAKEMSKHAATWPPTVESGPELIRVANENTHNGTGTVAQNTPNIIRFTPVKIDCHQDLPGEPEDDDTWNNQLAATRLRGDLEKPLCD